MRTIIKGREPASLTQHRNTPHSDFDNYSDKDELRAALVREQRGICCYCMARIRPDAQSMKIEHWRSQARHPAEQLDYANLLAACCGGQKPPERESSFVLSTEQRVNRKNHYCDTHKADQDISRNPANPSHQVESLIRYGNDGSISSSNSDFDFDLKITLNLNTAFLKNNRRAVLDGFTASLSRSGRLQAAWIARQISEWNGDSAPGELRPYCQIVVYWLRRRLNRT